MIKTECEKATKQQQQPMFVAKDLKAQFRRPNPNNEQYTRRLEEEFTLIDKNGFARVFQQVQRIMELCKELSIPHIIRGSAGSSLVCFLLGISHTDPIQYGMDLTRFMNHGRTDMPDIDIDIPYNRRDELYERIGKEWPNQVARISNHVLYQYKSALQEVLRQKKLQYKKNVPLEQLIPDPEAAAKIKQELYEKMGTLRTESLHCGGIVIFDKEGSVPKDLILKNDGILPQIKLNKDETEDAGYIKIDLLSNRGMAQWWEASNGRPLLEYPQRDDGVARLFATGSTIGLTFGESRGMRHIFKQMMPNTIEDISIALALIRPAAAAGGRKASFLAGFKAGMSYTNENKPIVYDDDALDRIRAILPNNLEKDTIDSLADQFRKAFSKQRIGDCLRFRDMCRLKGLSEHAVKQTIDDLNQLQHYSFCKSHALSYAQLLWALAYEKVHSPETFWVATLNHCNSEYRTWVHWREARHAGLLLSRGKPPYKLVKTDKESRIVSKSGEQMVLMPDNVPSQQYADFKQFGYWLSKDFFHGCYRRVETKAQRKLKTFQNACIVTEKEHIVHFRGLIATGRVCRSDTDGEESSQVQNTVTFLCIGVDNGIFLDLVIHGNKWQLLGYAAVEGKGKVRNPTDESVEVTTIKGISLKALTAV